MQCKLQANESHPEFPTTNAVKPLPLLLLFSVLLLTAEHIKHFFNNMHIIFTTTLNTKMSHHSKLN